MKKWHKNPHNTLAHCDRLAAALDELDAAIKAIGWRPEKWLTEEQISQLRDAYSAFFCSMPRGRLRELVGSARRTIAALPD